jgi:hypothetical protein
VYRNPFLDIYAGALFALGGPMALMLPQRIFIAMLTADPDPAPTAVRTNQGT